MTHAGIIASVVPPAGADIARQYFFAQSLGSASNTDAAAWTTHVTLAATLDVGPSYAVFWSCEIREEGLAFPFANQTADARLTQDAATLDTAAFQTTSDENSEGWMSVGGLAFVVGAGATSFTLDFRRHTDTFDEAARLRNGRITVLRLESADKHAESLARQTTSSTTFVDAATLTFTPGSSGTYLILGFGIIDGTVAQTGSVRLYDGATGTTDIAASSEINGDKLPIVTAWVKPGLSGAQSFKLQYRTHNGASPAGITGARLLALRLDGFTRVHRASLNADALGGVSSYAEAMGLAANIPDGDYLVLSAWAVDVVPTVGDADLLSVKFNDPSATLNEFVGAPRANGYRAGFIASIAAYTAGARAWSLQSKGPGGSHPGSVIKDTAVIAVFQLT